MAERIFAWCWNGDVFSLSVSDIWGNDFFRSSEVDRTLPDAFAE